MNVVFRNALSIVRKLEVLAENAKSIRDIFSVSANSLRNKLKEQCYTATVSDKEDISRKAEDLVWRKIYHDVNQYHKRFKLVSRCNFVAHSHF